VDNLIGEEYWGIGLMLTGINLSGRLGGAAVCLGIADAVLTIAAKYARERKLYGKPLTNIQSILFMLGQMGRNVARARMLLYHAGWLADQGKKSHEIGGEISMAKLNASVLLP
jgi:alkylation response protein AidB-like acyl-CoA dehydrogenase